MKVYAIIPDDSEWEDITLFSTLEEAQKSAVETVRSLLRTFPAKFTKPERFDSFHIEEFDGTGKLTPTYESYRLVCDKSVEEWYMEILEDTKEYGKFFYRLA